MKNKRVWVYCRVAYPDAHALTIQQANLKEYAKVHGFEIVGTTAEQASGLNFSRNGLNEVSSAVAAGKVDILLVANLSRFGRSIDKVDSYLRWLKSQSVEMICTDGFVPQVFSEKQLQNGLVASIADADEPKMT